MFDFLYNDATSSLEKVGHYSRAENREATREEALLWRKLQALEEFIETQRPNLVKTLLRLIGTDEAKMRGYVTLNPNDFSLLRQFAQDRVNMVEHAEMNRKKILGCLPFLEDGMPSSIWISVDRSVPEGEVKLHEVPRT